MLRKATSRGSKMTIMASASTSKCCTHKKSSRTPEKPIYSDNKSLVKAKLKLLNGLKRRESAEKILDVLKQKMKSAGTEKQKFLLPKFSSYAEREASISSHREYFEKKRKEKARSTMESHIVETSRT
jgi:hypothetical protein